MEDINKADVSYSSQEELMDKNGIPELMIPTFETVPSEDSESVSTNKPLISPGNDSNNTKDTASEPTKNHNDQQRSTSPPNPPATSQSENLSAISSPSNPSAPLTSPAKSEKNSMLKNLSSPPLPNGASTKADSSNDSVLNNLNGPPAPIGQRGRVVSLDRGRYMNNHNLNAQKLYVDDDDGSGSSIGSSDGEGSYFSERLPSPPRRRIDSIGSKSNNPRLLPPGSGSIHSRTNNNYPHMPKLRTEHHFPAESDLSLSSSSCEEDYNRNTNHLPNVYPMNRTHSAPVQGSSLKPKPRNSAIHDVNNSSYYSEGNGHFSTQHDTIDDYNLPLPKSAKRFPSTSSLVSSSSEDVERKHSSSSRHRRQSSCRSVGSITSTGSALLPDKQRYFGSNDSDFDEPKQPPELVSFPGNRHLKTSTSKRLPHDFRIPRAKHQPLTAEQLNAWRNGMVKNDSYVSSSNGNNSGQDISPEKGSKTFSENASQLDSHSKSASSHQSKNGSGIFVYSEDDTDESARYREINNIESDANGNDAASTSGSFYSEQPSTIKQKRSFGKDITNKEEVEPTGRNAQINPSPDHRFRRNDSSHPHMSPVTNGNPTSMNYPAGSSENVSLASSRQFKVYWKRWVMLFYMSLLNLLSDWTCFSVAPIALLMTESFHNINPEHLVTIFLFANTVSTMTEPMLLARLGLRKTIVFGSFLLMMGNIIKSGGIPGVIGDGLEGDNNVWRLYTGFFLVGLSQPLYQCTPSILSSSWFPEKERTLATGIALNSNQLGIGCSFVFGSLLVVSSADIPKYFGLLSTLSTLIFIGCYLQFQDAPPTPPSETARVMKGNSSLPYFSMHQNLPQYFRMLQAGMGYEQLDPYANGRIPNSRGRYSSAGSSESRSSRNRESESYAVESTYSRESRNSRKSRRSNRKDRGSPTGVFKSVRTRSRRSGGDSKISSSVPHKQRSHGSRSYNSEARSSRRGDVSRRHQPSSIHLPSPGIGCESTEDVISKINRLENEAGHYGAIYPSPMMQGRVRQQSRRNQNNYDTPERYIDYSNNETWHYPPYGSTVVTPSNPYTLNQSGQYYSNYGQHPEEEGETYPETPFPNLRYAYTPSTSSQNPAVAPYGYGETPMQYYPPITDPRFLNHRPPLPAEYYHYQDPMNAPFHRTPQPPIYLPLPFNSAHTYLSRVDGPDDGAEPVVSHAGSFLSIDVRDDQVFRSIKACFSRPGFLHTVIAFAVSGIVLNTISTYTDSLLSLIGAGRSTVGIVGGFFQILVMISSMIVGKVTDKKRRYYCVVIGLLVIGAFTLAECAINLEAERGSSLIWTLLILAVFVGPLQPVATELGVEVVYPLSENTVLVVQQLVSNFASAIFIPFFQSAKNFAREGGDFERPQYTFSFVVLMATHVIATLFFATFNGTYKRLEHEQRRKKERAESKKNMLEESRKSSSKKEFIADEEQQALL